MSNHERVLYNHTRLHDDLCEKQSQTNTNQSLYNRDTRIVCEDNNRHQYMNSMDLYGVYQSQNYDGHGHYVDNESALRLGCRGNRLTHYKSKADMLLHPREHVTTPYKGAGVSRIVDQDAYDRLLWEPTNCGAGKNHSTSVEMDRFIPLIPEIKETVQDTRHIIPSTWIRGGMDTRSVIRNVDYLRACGMKN